MSILSAIFRRRPSPSWADPLPPSEQLLRRAVGTVRPSPYVRRDRPRRAAALIRSPFTVSIA